MIYLINLRNKKTKKMIKQTLIESNLGVGVGLTGKVVLKEQYNITFDENVHMLSFERIDNLSDDFSIKVEFIRNLNFRKVIQKAIIPYFGKKVSVKCDGKCDKAWGKCERPLVELSDDVDDYYYLSDDELGIAPKVVNTYEGNDTKPLDVKEFPNKWCVRSCERCAMGKSEPEDWSKRVYNIKR